MTSKKNKQIELPFKPTEFQLDLLIGKTNSSEKNLQFFSSKQCQIKSNQIEKDESGKP
jgi:hypothetical protein